MWHLHLAVAAAVALALITVGAVPAAVHAGKWWRQGQYQVQTASGSSCASPGKHSTLFLSCLHIQTGLMQTRTYKQGGGTWDDCNPPNLTVCLVHLRCVSLPVWVNRTLVELNGVFSILEFTWWALKLWTNPAETGVTLTDRSTDRQVSLCKITNGEDTFRCCYLEGVGPTARFIVQHLQEVSSTLLRGAQLLHR